MRVGVVGQGYVGLTTAVGLAAAGHTVTGIECDRQRLEALQAGRSPMHEPDLQPLLSAVLGDGLLRFRRSLADEDESLDTLLIAVATPSLPSGGVDLGQVRSVLDEVLTLPALPALIVLKSTIPPGTSLRLLAGAPGSAALRNRYVCNPEFLNQGRALLDWHRPARIVVGTWNSELLPVVKELYRGIAGPWVVTTPTNAELIKYASNAFLATKISFANEIANLCEAVGGDIDCVIEGVGHDPRIGSAFLKAGLGYGDSCLPKDVRALIHMAGGHGQALRLLEAVAAVNAAQRLRVAQVVRQRLGRWSGVRPVVAVLGLSYEPWSDDMREAPSLTVIPELAGLGVRLRAWDPLLPPQRIAQLFPGLDTCDTVEEAMAGAAAAVILSEYPLLVCSDWRALAAGMAPPRLIVDGKNCLVRGIVEGAEMEYTGIGRRWSDGARE